MTLNFREDKPEVYKVHQISYPMVDFASLLKEVAHAENINETQTSAVILGLLNRCSMYLGMGHGVSLGTFGSLKPVLRSKTCKKKEDADASTINKKVVRFYPGKELRDAVQSITVSDLESLSDMID